MKPSPVLTVDITSPSGDVSTNGVVSIQLSVSGGTPDQVELLVDGKRQTLMCEPWQYAWHTTNVPEGEHILTARATKAGKTYTGPVRKVFVDRTAPTIAVRTPAAGATNVPVAATISATFSEPVNPATVTTASVTLTSGSSAVPRTVSLSADRKTLTITPNSPPVPPVTWTVGLNGVTDPAGNPLQQPSSAWTFAYPAWLPVGGALSAVGGTTLAERPQLKIDPMGRPVVAWIESDGAQKNVYVRRWDGTQWQALGTKLSALNGTGTHVELVSLALDSAGNPVVVWNESNGATDSIHARHWSDTSGWSTVGTRVVDTGDLSVTSLSVVVERAGNPIVSWAGYNGGAAFTQVVRWSGASWSPYPDPTTVHAATGAFNCWDESLALTDNGLPFVAFTCWVETAGVTYRSVYVSGWSGSAWQHVGSGVLVPGHVYSRYPSLQVDSDENPVVAWVSGVNHDAFTVHAAAWTGSTWQRLDSNLNWNSGDARDGTLVLSPSGALVVAWNGVFSGTRKIGASTWSGNTWADVGTALESDGLASTAASKPSMAFDAAGTLTVAFQEGTASAGDVFVYRLKSVGSASKNKSPGRAKRGRGSSTAQLDAVVTGSR